MNERIKELARRVVGKHRNDVSSISLFDEQIEKFAELIMRECCQFENSYSGVAGLVARDYSRQIKGHFGVEE